MKTIRKDRPGYQRRRRSDGTYIHYWNPSRATKKAPEGLPIRQITAERIIADLPALEFNDIEEAIPSICQFWTDQLLEDISAIKQKAAFDGTLSSTDPALQDEP